MTAGAPRASAARAVLLVGPVLALIAFGLYWWIGPDQRQTDPYLPLADAWLHGRANLDGMHYTWIELALYRGQWFVPFPPTATVAVLPFVAIFGQAFDTNLTSAVVGAIGVWLMWGLMRQVGLNLRTALFLTVTWAVGSEAFWVSAVGGTHLFAETIAATLLIAVLRLSLAGRAPVLAGLLLAAAVGARLPVVFALPLVVGLYTGLPTRLGRPSEQQVIATVDVGLGMLGPAVGIAAYNLVRFGSPLEFGYGLITSRSGESVLDEPWYSHGLLSPLYLPRGLFAMLGRQWDFVDEFPWLHPTWAGQAVTFTMPLVLWVIWARLRDPLVAYALGSAALILLVDLVHGETGYAQFGYRFVVDALPIIWLVLATVLKRGVGRGAAIAGVLGILAFSYGLAAIYGFGFVGT